MNEHSIDLGPDVIVEGRSITCATGQRSGDRICLGLPRVPHATNLAEFFYENLFFPGDIHD
jgi:hypothetical protein